MKEISRAHEPVPPTPPKRPRTEPDVSREVVEGSELTKSVAQGPIHSPRGVGSKKIKVSQKIPNKPEAKKVTTAVGHYFTGQPRLKRVKHQKDT